MITSEQLEAINEQSKSILVKAGAGTGKTEVLSRRILKLLQDNPDLSVKQMAIITFTNKATEELQERLKRFFYHQWKSAVNPNDKRRYRYELESLNSATIATIHSFCQEILRLAGPYHQEQLHFSPAYQISNRPFHLAVDTSIEEWIQEAEAKNKTLWLYKIMPTHELKKMIKQTYNMIRSMGLSFDEVLNITRHHALLESSDMFRYLKNELITVLKQVDRNYKDNKLRTYDVDDLLEYCFQLLKQEPTIVQQVKDRFRYIFVDEFQDTSLYQTGIIKAICDGTPEAPHLFVVGDAKQSIYKFRGADLDSYSSVEKWIKKVGKVLHLSINFRSTPAVVSFVNYTFEVIAEENPDLAFLPEPLRTKEDTADLDISQAYTWLYESIDSSQPQVVANYLLDRNEEGVHWNQFAILFRRNIEMQKYASELAAKSIPFNLIGAGNFYNQKEIVSVYKVINFLLDQDSQIIKEEALETLFFNKNISLLHFVGKEFNEQKDKLTPSQILEWLYRIANVRERFLQVEPQMVSNLNKLKEIIRKRGTSETLRLEEFKDWLFAMITSENEESQADIAVEEGTDAVTLITIHKSKGLEYPIVILPELNQEYSKSVLRPPVIYNPKTGLEMSYRNYFEGYASSSDGYDETVKFYKEDMFSEELRVLYVALTRAKKHVVLVGDKNCPQSRVCFQNWLLKPSDTNDLGQSLKEVVDYSHDNLIKIDNLLTGVEKNTEETKSNSPDLSDLWDHQRKAVERFLEKGNGVLNMATGTGKTRTALAILNKLFSLRKISTVIITVAGNDLLDQWWKNLLVESKLLLYREYGEHKQLLSYLLNPEQAVLIVQRNPKHLLKLVNKLSEPMKRETLIICDEVHGMGSEGLVESLKEEIRCFGYRLGLSATPEKEYDEEGNQFILEEIGPELYRFDLSDAICKGILCEFDYTPLSYELTEQDREQTVKVIRAYHAAKKNGESFNIEQLYQQLARIKKESLGKLAVFEEYLGSNPEILKRSILFVETKEFGLEIQKIIINYLHNFHTYFGEDDQENLNRFSQGRIDCLITSRRISEGIDISSVNNIILFTADRSSITTIQRIGRCLRIDPNNVNKRAHVVDFIEESKRDEKMCFEDTEDFDHLTTDQIRKSWLVNLSKTRNERSRRV